MTAEDGVVQTTVSGTGNVEPATDQVVNFATSGTLESIYVQVGQHVNKGQLLATLSPTSDQLALDQADANLAAAKDNLTSAEDGTSSSSGSSGSGSGSGTSASLKSTDSASTEFVDYKFVSQTTPTRTTTAPTATTPTRTKPKHKKSGKKHKTSPTGSYGTGTTSTRPTTSTTSTASVPSTLLRIRGRASRATMRGPMIIANTGPSPNITSGLRTSR